MLIQALSALSSKIYVLLAGVRGPVGALRPRAAQDAEVGKQSKKTLLDIFGRYIEGYMTLFDTI